MPEQRRGRWPGSGRTAWSRLTADQILVQRVDVLVGRNNTLDPVAVERDSSERTRELLPVPGHHQYSEPVVVHLDLSDVFLAEQQRRHARCVPIAAPDDVLAGMLLGVVAHASNRPVWGAPPR